jgi:hypothetical protein
VLNNDMASTVIGKRFGVIIIDYSTIGILHICPLEGVKAL